jgi:hypothetical protein
MRVILPVALMIIAISGCSGSREEATRGRTTQMFPDCTQVSAEEQAKGNCMTRPELPDGDSLLN